MNNSVPIFSAVIGGIILLFGRKLFWLCVAALGFAAGVEMAPHILVQPSPLLQLSFALVLGFLGALLALLLQKLAVGLFGFAAGARLALGLSTMFAGQVNLYWLIALGGGIIGAILLLALFDWAVIVISAILGAYLIAGAITLPPTGATVLVIALAAFGVAVQSAIFRRQRTVA